jgi:hypothetical protein
MTSQATLRVPVRLLLALALPLVVCGVAHAETAARRVIRVALAPVEHDKMSGLAWRAMTRECSRIWADEGVALTWSGDSAGAHVVLPLVFHDRDVRKHDPKNEDALGVTVFSGRSQLILVSIARARRVLERRKGLADSTDGLTLDMAMGMLLGRVIAHEIGHALLLTTRHSPDGLMRARFGAGELRPALDGQFALSRSERDHLAVRFSNTPAPGTLVLAEFTWSDAPPLPARPRAPR